MDEESSQDGLRLRAPTSGAEPVVETWTTLDEMQRADNPALVQRVDARQLPGT